MTAHFIQADTIVPKAGSSKAYDRYGDVGYNPINFNDPSGHDSILIDDFIRPVIILVQNPGYTVIGNPSAKSINANGADIVAVIKNGEQVIDTLAVEMKNVVGNVNLGTLGQSTGVLNDYGGSISRVVRSATRLLESQNEQLRIESQAIINGSSSGNLRNVLVTTSDNVSVNAQKIFEGVYTGAKNGVSNSVKVLPAALSSTGRALSSIAIGLPQVLLPPIPLMFVNPKNFSIQPKSLVQ